MNGTVVRQYDTSDDGEAKSGAIFLIGYKRSENGLLVFRGNAASVVLHGDHQPFVVGKHFQRYASPPGDGLDGILNQIDKGLL